MTSNSDKQVKDTSVLAKLNSDGEESSDQPSSTKSKSILSEINENQSKKKSNSK